MAVKVRERNGAWWIFIDHQRQRRHGEQPHRIAELARGRRVDVRERISDAVIGVGQAERVVGLVDRPGEHVIRRQEKSALRIHVIEIEAHAIERGGSGGLNFGNRAGGRIGADSRARQRRCVL